MEINSNAVFIVAGDAAFPRDLLDRWRQEHPEPEFTVMGAEFLGGASGNFDVAVVGPLRNGRLASVLKALHGGAPEARTREAGERPVICVLESPSQAQAIQAEFPRLLAMRRHEGWPESVLLLATECLKRVDLAARVRKSEHAALAHARHAALGAFMLENRHDFNNLLTSLLGNAELLLLDSGHLAEAAREQVETIHAMALQMYEMMQRFSSRPPPIELAGGMKGR